jgi:hypothetical protein
VTAASCLDQLANDGSCVLVDIRTAREKEAGGVPDVPSSGSARLIEVEYAFTEDRKLRGQLKDVGAIEATVSGPPALRLAARLAAAGGAGAAAHGRAVPGCGRGGQLRGASGACLQRRLAGC